MDAKVLVTEVLEEFSALDVDVRQRLAAARMIASNRRMFDEQVIVAQAVVAEEAAELRAQLEALRTSTFWRVTRPVRWFVERARSWRPVTAPDAAMAPVALSAQEGARNYRAWCLKEEPKTLAALADLLPGQQEGGQHDVPTQSLGLVFLASGDSGPALAALLANCPPACKILVLDEEEQVPLGLAADNRVVRRPVPAGFAPAESVAIALDALDTDLLCFHDGRDRLAPEALFLVAAAFARQPDLDLVFADEDWLTKDGQRTEPFFKPGWDSELQCGRDLIGPFAFFRTTLIRAATCTKGRAWRYDLASQIAAATQADRIHHIPAVLCHRHPETRVPDDALREAAAAGLRRNGVKGRVEPVPGQGGRHRVVYQLPAAEPLVSIIICTRDHAELLRACADGVLNHTDYSQLEVIIVDNGTAEPDALALLESLAADVRVRILRAPGPFNWSALNNAAAASANGDVFVLLNNDIAVLRPDWLTVLVSHAMQPGVGAVGAKLLYPDGRVQHAGLTTDQSGIPRHLFRRAPGDEAGPFGLMGLAREVWGLTGACVAIPRFAFFGVGGLNESMPVTCNDVEMCLRLTAHGYRLVWTPWSVLEHREQASRGSDHTDGKRRRARHDVDRLIRDWGNLVMHDPFLNQNLALQNEQPVFRMSPLPPSR